MQNYKSSQKADTKYRAYKFSLELIKFVSGFPKAEVYKVVGNQLLRCGTSVGANIVEAKSSSSKREFIKFFEISLKSANETKYWLCLLKDSDLVIDKNVVKDLLDEIYDFEFWF